MPSSRIKFRISSRFLAGAVLALVLTGAASCSSVWDDVTSFIEDDEANDRALTNSNDGEDFPKLSDVPDTIRPASSPEDLDQLAEGLVADRSEARYTDETLRSRYADAAEEKFERQVAAASSAPEFADLAEQRIQSSGIEPASDAVLGDRQALDREERAIARESDSYSASASREITQLRETRVAFFDPSADAYGVMPISQFRDLFNARFDSSGRSPYQNAEVRQQAAQVAGDRLATDRILASDTENLVRAEMELATPEPPLSYVAEDSGLAAISFQATSIPFAVGSAALNSSDRAQLKKVAELHEQFGGVVRVIGHASRRTRDMEFDTHQWVNFQLSLDRATAVSVELTRLGVPAQSMLVMARSDNEPLTYEYMPKGEAENRRADIYIEY
jgi:flagellar motor protein MotB